MTKQQAKVESLAMAAYMVKLKLAEVRQLGNLWYFEDDQASIVAELEAILAGLEASLVEARGGMNAGEAGR